MEAEVKSDVNKRMPRSSSLETDIRFKVNLDERKCMEETIDNINRLLGRMRSKERQEAGWPFRLTAGHCTLSAPAVMLPNIEPVPMFR